MATARPSIVAMIGCAGMAVASLPVERATRPGGASAYNSWRRIRSATRALGWVLAWKWKEAGAAAHYIMDHIGPLAGCRQTGSAGKAIGSESTRFSHRPDRFGNSAIKAGYHFFLN